MASALQRPCLGTIIVHSLGLAPMTVVFLVYWIQHAAQLRPLLLLSIAISSVMGEIARQVGKSELTIPMLACCQMKGTLFPKDCAVCLGLGAWNRITKLVNEQLYRRRPFDREI